jgi:hypothetical protein
VNEAIREDLPDDEKNALSEDNAQRANHRASEKMVVPSAICVGSNKPVVRSPGFGSTFAALFASGDFVADFVGADGRDTPLGLFDGCGVILGWKSTQAHSVGFSNDAWSAPHWSEESPNPKLTAVSALNPVTKIAQLRRAAV